MENLIPFVIPIVFIGICVVPAIVLGIKEYKKTNGHAQKIWVIIKCLFMALFIASFLLFVLGSLVRSSAEYYEQIDPVEKSYTAFAGKHYLSLAVYFILYIISVSMVLAKKRNMPPLMMSLCVAFIIIGTVLNVTVLIQYIEFDHISNIRLMWREDTGGLALHHIMHIILSLYLLISLVLKEKEISHTREYENRFLNAINNIIGRHYFVGAFVLLIPLFIIITLILLLFGQEKDSIIKVWTETATWTLSQREHPPFLDHQGHYLCTVAACGHPSLVKPLRLGIRHGKTITVNRQLLIANAYEAMIQNRFPAFHCFIRNVYDRCGYPVSKHITNKYISDALYILMKPLEYFFLINLYFFVLKPEELISKQYK